MHVALVNTNRIKPPIAPIGLEYVAEALNAAGHHVAILDLCWAADSDSAIVSFFDRTSFDLVGVTLRNTDDCVFTSRQSFLSDFANMVSTIRKHTDALIVLGGVGFSVMPEHILKLCEADVGIWGDGEFVLAELANRMDEKREWFDLPNLILRRDGRWHRNLPSTQTDYLCHSPDMSLQALQFLHGVYADAKRSIQDSAQAPRSNLQRFGLTDLPTMNRNWIDNRRYFREGGQIGLETKRGCSRHCIYCADPIAKGKEVRTRPPKAVVDELENLLKQGIDHIHTCDSEFNLPEWHASEVCKEIIRRDLDDKLHWYAYCSPVSFSLELAKLMRRAGCVGINFGVDNGDEEMLRRLKRDFTLDDILNSACACREAGIAVMFDLLLGSPGETRESIIRTIDLMKRADADRVGVALGVRVYPGTELADLVMQEAVVRDDGYSGGLVDGDAPLAPIFFIEPEIAPFAFELLDELIGDDKRFFFFDPSRPDKNYNYNANQRLVDAISKGYRGAYWDILRRYN